jgi:dGTPase
LIQVRTAAQQRLAALFACYLAQPEHLPAKFQLRAGEVGLRRAVGDYLAGMTDRFCDAQYRQLVRQ